MGGISDLLAQKGIAWLKEEWEQAKDRNKDEKWPYRLHHWCGTPDIMNRLLDTRKKDRKSYQRGEKKSIWD